MRLNTHLVTPVAHNQVVRLKAQYHQEQWQAPGTNLSKHHPVMPPSFRGVCEKLRQCASYSNSSSPSQLSGATPLPFLPHWGVCAWGRTLTLGPVFDYLWLREALADNGQPPQPRCCQCHMLSSTVPSPSYWCGLPLSQGPHQVGTRNNLMRHWLKAPPNPSHH